MINMNTIPEKKNELEDQRERVLVSYGKKNPELVLKNASFVNVFTNELEKGDIAIHKGYIVGIGDYSESAYFQDKTNNVEGCTDTNADLNDENINNQNINNLNINNQNINNQKTTFVDCTNKIICPGFIDGHIHIESSMLSPKEFAETVVPHGTTSVITDPHEIANVAGTVGIDFMLANSEGLPLDIYLMMPSCVPATPLDESGAVLEAEELAKYFKDPRVLGLAELMNAYGTVRADENIFRKISLTKEHNKIIDGHAPGLQGKELNTYITAGVTSDHECSTIEDAMLKLKRGQWIMIREGTAAKNMEALMPLFQEPYCNRCMLVTDDRHPGELLKLGHVDYLVRKAIEYGADPIIAIKMATLQPALYFGLKEVGVIAPGYKADLVIIDDLKNITVESIYKNGKEVSAEGKVTSYIPLNNKEFQKVYNSFNMKELTQEDLLLKGEGNQMRVIELVSGELLTKLRIEEYIQPGVNTNLDIVKLAVIERHKNSGHIGLGFLKGYGLKAGAIASSIAHDSHNLIIAGTNDTDMCLAGNCVRKNQGGIAIALDGKIIAELALPIAGLMSNGNAEEVENKLEVMKQLAKNMGISDGVDPFMTLAFLSLPVIPEVRLTTLGLVEVNNQHILNAIF